MHVENEHAPLDEAEYYEREQQLPVHDGDEESGSEPELEHDISEEEGEMEEDDDEGDEGEGAVLATIAKRRAVMGSTSPTLGQSPATSLGTTSSAQMSHQASLSQAAIISGLSSMSHNRRQAHIASEQKRRQSINDGFEDLRRAVPSCMSASDSKATILRKACNYIRQLQNELVRAKGGMAGVSTNTASYGHVTYQDAGRQSPAYMHASSVPSHLNRSYIAPAAPTGYVQPHLQPVHGIPVQHAAPQIQTSYHHPPPQSMPHMSSQHQQMPPPPPHMSQGPPYGHGHTSPQQQHALPPIQYSGYGQGGNYQGHMQAQPSYSSQQHHLPQPVPQAHPVYPSYNRDDYVSAASLSMLRQEGSGSNTPTEQHPNESRRR